MIPGGTRRSKARQLTAPTASARNKPVFVYKLIVREGIEGAIELLKSRKAALAEALFANSAKTPFDLTEADISALFVPLDYMPDRRAA